METETNNFQKKRYLLEQLELGLLEQDLERLERISKGEGKIDELAEIVGTAIDILEGRYEAVLLREELISRIEKLLETGQISLGEFGKDIECTWYLLGAIACICLFVQYNWTGPDPQSNKISQLKWSQHESLRNLHESMSVDGEIVYSKVEHLEFLHVATVIFNSELYSLSSLQTYVWWKLRCNFLHERLLSNRTFKLKNATDDNISNTSKLLQTMAQKFTSETVARYFLEEGLIHHHFGNMDSAQECFDKAKAASGLQTRLTGSMGVRTKYQQIPTPQLFLEAKSAQPSAASHKDVVMPVEVENTVDDLLLPKPKLEIEEKDNTTIRVIDQAIILALCLNVKNQNPKHGLTTEEMNPYVAKVQESPQNWMVHSTCLLTKSRLEFESRRTADRAALQVEVLVKQYSDTEPSVKERIKYLFCLAFPSRWELKKELGEQFLQLGAAASALKMFEELDMWEQIINCYMVMSKNKQAEEIVRNQIAKNPTPLLYCILGDLTSNIQHYETAWELSGHHFARAQRSLAASALRRNDLEKCIAHFEIALAINPMYKNSWFNMGCAAMKLSLWDKAIQAFQRVIQLEPEEGEAWNNLGSIFIKQSKKKEAARAFQEALKFIRNDWRIWNNYTLSCMDIGEFQHAINAIGEILQIKPQEVDLHVVSLLCRVVTENIADAHGTPGSQFRQQVESLIRQIASSITTSPTLWEIASKLYSGLGDTNKAVEFAEKRYRALQQTGWEREEKKFEQLANGLLDLVNLYSVQATADSWYNAGSLLRSVLKKAEDSFVNTPQYKQLQNKLQEVAKMEQL